MLRKTTIQIEVLDDPNQQLNPSEMDIEAIAYGVTHGTFSGKTNVIKSEILGIEDSIKECIEQGSDPEFFEIPEDVTEKDIVKFLEENGTKVQENEPDHYVELTMDNHKCVEYNGVQYYIPEDLDYGVDEVIYDLLVHYYHV